MPCSICGLAGHNASTCYKKTIDEEAVLEANGVTTAPEATKKDEVTTPGKSSSVGANGSEDAPPTKKPRTKEEAIRGPVQVPSDDDCEVNVAKVMASVCWAVCTGLPEMLHEFGIVPSANVPLYEHQPLDIKPSTEKGVAATISNYKEPWRKSRALESVQHNQMYEAGGNPFWFRHSTTDVGDEFPRETVPWPLLAEYRDTLFACPQNSTRMLFPTTLLGHLVSPNAIGVDFFPGNIVLVCGAPILWAMYREVLHIIRACLG